MSAALSGDVVLKPVGAWGPAVVALLRHLESAGFPGAPRVVGDGYVPDGRLAVTYVPVHRVTPDTADAVTPDGFPVLWAIAWRARSASWIARHRTLLRRALA